MKCKVICTGVENKKKRFEQGDPVTDKDFSKKVLNHWVKIGRLELLSKPKEDDNGG